MRCRNKCGGRRSSYGYGVLSMKKCCGSCLYLNKTKCNSSFEPCVSCNENYSGFEAATNGDMIRAIAFMDNNELSELMTELQGLEKMTPWEWKEYLEKTVDISK